APFTWEIAEGSLPRGITLDPGGSLNGTPDDPEEVGVEFTFTLRVTDSCLIPQTAEGTFSVTLQPAPACDPVAITTPELPDAFLGEAYDATVEAAGGQPPYDFDLASGSLPSGITLSGSGALTGTPTNLEEVGTTFVVGVRVTDSCPFTPGTDIRNYSLTLFERCQPLAITTEELPDPTFGLDYSVALDSSGGSGTLTWSLEEGRLPSGLTLTPQGTLDGVPDNESQVGEEFSFTVRVADECPQGAQSDLQDYTIILQPNCTDPVITTESLPDATLLEPYNVQLEVAGGTGPFTWTVEPEDLPTGLTLNPDGSITGTPTNPEEIGREFLIDVEVTDSCPLGPRSDTARLPLQLLAPCEPLNITNTGFANPVLGQAYNATLFATGEPPLEWSLAAGSLPSGMSVDPEGTLGGTPNDPKQVGQTFNFTLAVTDSCVAGPQLDTAEFQFTLLPPVPCGPVSITTTDLPDFIFGEPYNQAVQATGGQPPYIWDLVEGSLPDGITFNEATGVLSGTPTNPKQVNSEWFLFIRVQDSCPFNPTFDDVDLQIDLHGPDCNGPVSITTTDLADFVFGEPYSESVEATGGLPPYRWELVESALPDGITFDGDSGTFSGTPNNPQQINTEWIFHVRVTDSCVIPTSDQQVLLVDLHGPDCNGPVTITTTDLPDFRFGEPYSEAVQATGGLQPYTWELVEGGLPSGITFNEATGTFEGTPDDPEQIDSEWFFQVRVTDACVIPTSDDVTLFIDLHGPTCTDRNFTFLTEGLPRATFGVPYNAQLEVSGGLAPYTFEAIDGTPPAGLTLNPDGSITGTITDPNQVGRHFFTVRATDACVLPNVAIRDFMILVDPPNCQEIGIQNTGFPDPILGTPYNATLFASGEPPFTWSLMAGSLPDGMSVDPTGAITGTPNNPQQISGTFTFTIRVEDSCAIPQFDFQQYSFTLQPAFCPELGILFMDYPDPILNQPYNEPLEAEGFPPFTWQLAPESNPMPTGMFIDPEGFITGTPTNPQEIGREFGFRVQVTDSCPNGPQTGFTTVRFILESCPPVNITTTGLPAPELGQYYEQPLMAAGGQQPYTWSLVGGSLPTGLHLDPTGRILGTPMNPNEAQFTFTFTVQVTDSCNPMSSDQQQFQVSLQIGGCFPDPFVIVNAGNIGDAVFQQPFTYRFFSDGGYPTYGWFLASGTLPTGLSLHPLTGVLSGTPSNPDQVGDTFVFEIQVQSSGCKEVTPVTRVVMRVVPSGG
ncbi:MAG TPA: Ig domain-containing protein, partial [bacterium]|nr:Ig domain-containing protein [bacterium]